MKKIILVTAMVLLVFTACKSDLFNNLEVTGIDLKPESDTVPAIVIVYIDQSGDKGIINYKIYHEGAFYSLYGTDSDTVNSSSFSYDYSYILDKKVLDRDSAIYFYRNPGTYEIKLVVEDGDTFTETFTLY